MDGLQTTVLVIATLVVAGGGALVAVRELTAPDRRRVGAVRDVIEVSTPILGLLVLIIAVWSLR